MAEDAVRITSYIRNGMVILLGLLLAGNLTLAILNDSDFFASSLNDVAVLLSIMSLGIIIIVENLGRAILYVFADPNKPENAAGIILSFVVVGFGLGLLRIFLPRTISILVPFLGELF